MKASQLVVELKRAIKEHGDQEVITEGCDCDGKSGAVVFKAKQKGWKQSYFLIERSDSEEPRV